ncbi:MAG: nucleoside 2-deoxyribosyltransferase [Planctomycetota bacterium]|nr:nucleoside 2-deoxyribosyltransferase [Planctomycetota bacterium]
MGATVYIAGPLFSMAERRFNRTLADGLRKAIPDCEVILPQDFKPHGRYNDPRAFGAIFRECVEGVRRADVLVAVLDGEDVDSGTAFEMGVAYQKGTPIVGVRTDFRANQECGVNIMISRACARMPRVLSFGEDIDAAVEAVARAVRKVLAQAGIPGGAARREVRTDGAAARGGNADANRP